MKKMILLSLLMAPFLSFADTILTTPAVQVEIKAGTGVSRKSSINAQLSYQIYCDGHKLKLSHFNPIIFIDSDFSLSEPSGDVITKNIIEFKNGKAQIPPIKVTERSVSHCDRINLFYDITQIELKTASGKQLKIEAAKGQMAQMQRQGSLVFDIHTSSMREQSFIPDLPFFNAPLITNGQGESQVQNLVVINLK